MSGTFEMRFGTDGRVTAQSYIRLSGSAYIRCCTYPDHAPILTIQDGPVDITITNPAGGEVTADDVAFGRELAEAVARYVAELERLAPTDHAAEADPDSAGRAA